MQRLLAKANAQAADRIIPPHLPSEPRGIRALRRRLGAEVIASIVVAYGNGSSVRELAITYCTSSDGMLRILRQEGVQMRYQSVTEGQVARLIHLYNEGNSIYDIETLTGIPKTSVTRALKANGVQMRGRGGSGLR